MSLTDPLQVLPFWLERQIDPASPDFLPGSAAEPRNLTHRRVTTVGVRARPERAAVDARGLVTPDQPAGRSTGGSAPRPTGRGGGAGRWRALALAQPVPGRPPAPRRSAPVVETGHAGARRRRPAPGLRVPEHRAGTVRGDRDREPQRRARRRRPRRAAVPPLGLGRGPVHRARRAAPCTSTAGRRSSWPGRRPRPASATGHRDVLDSLVAGDDPVPGSEWSVARRQRAGHRRRSSRRWPTRPSSGPSSRWRPQGFGGGRGPLAWPDAVPSAEQVAKGWEAHVRQGVRLDLPDPRWQQVVDTAVPHLLLAHGGEDVAAWPAGPPPELARRGRRRAGPRPVGVRGGGRPGPGHLARAPGPRRRLRQPRPAGTTPPAPPSAPSPTTGASPATPSSSRRSSARWPRPPTGSASAAAPAGRTRDPQAVGLLPEGDGAGRRRAGGHLPARRRRVGPGPARRGRRPRRRRPARGRRRRPPPGRRPASPTSRRPSPRSPRRRRAVPATPSRRVDAGVVVNVDLFEPLRRAPARPPTAARGHARRHPGPAGR